jgi:hypothetical protein
MQNRKYWKNNFYPKDGGDKVLQNVGNNQHDVKIQKTTIQGNYVFRIGIGTYSHS